MELNKLIDIVINYTGVDIRNKCRRSDYVMARAIYFKLAYKDLWLGTLGDIGASLGKDHATVLYSINNTFNQLEPYFPHMYKKYLYIKDVVTSIADQDPEDRKEIQSLEEGMRGVSLLEQKVDQLSKEIASIKNGPYGEFIDIVRRIPDDKLEIFKVRIEAIAKMI